MKIFIGIILCLLLTIFHVFVFIGELFEFSHMGVLWLIVRCALITADIVLIAAGVFRSVKYRKRKKEKATRKHETDTIRLEAEKQRIAAAQQKKAEAERLREEERQRQEEERKREEEAGKKIDGIVTQYTLEPYVLPGRKELWKGKKLECSSSLVNTEVIGAVKACSARLQYIKKESDSLQLKSRDILGKQNFVSACDRLNYLNTNLKDLQFMRSRAEELYQEYCDKKVELSHQDEAISQRLVKDISLIGTSEKFRSDDIKREIMLKSELPEGLSMFHYCVRPAVLYVQDFCFCFFSSVILVFDDHGSFSTALKPSALSVISRRQSKIVFFTEQGSWGQKFFSTEDQYVGADSHLIEQGKEEHTWRYTRKDGRADMRYSNNPMFTNRTDTWEYGRVTITIAEFRFTFCVSSVACADALAEINAYYIKQ